MSELLYFSVTNNRMCRHLAMYVPRGITEICGANQAGKTSGIEMLMSILFGLRGLDFRKPQLTEGELRGGGKVLAPDHGFNSERSQRAENGGRP